MKKLLIISSSLLLFAAIQPGRGVEAVGHSETATVFSVYGKVSVVPRGSNVAVECRQGMQLNEGDWIKTYNDASVVISFDRDHENVISVKENSLIILRLDGYFKIHLLAGEIYAFLENVEKDETFRVLMPSVVTESESSGWGATSDGSYTNVMVFDNQAFVCGIKLDGSIDTTKFWIDEGYQRKTIKFQDPGEMRPVPEDIAAWFREQVVAHHLQRSLLRELAGEVEEEVPQKDQSPSYSRPAPGVFVADGEEVNLVEYLYRERLRRK